MRVLFSTLTQVLFSQHDISFFLRGAWIVSLSVIEHFDKTWFSPATFLILVFLPLGFEVQSHEIAEEALQTGHKKNSRLVSPSFGEYLAKFALSVVGGGKLDATNILLNIFYSIWKIFTVHQRKLVFPVKKPRNPSATLKVRSVRRMYICRDNHRL